MSCFRNIESTLDYVQNNSKMTLRQYRTMKIKGPQYLYIALH